MMRFMRRWSIRHWSIRRRLIFAPLLIYLAIVAVLALLETKLMYPAPDPSQGDWNPSWLEYEDVTCTTRFGNTIHGWYCPHSSAKTTILFCHGNGEHVAYLADELEFLRQRYSANVFAFDYRGYGKSEGKPFQAGILADAETAHAWLADRAGIQPNEIVPWGRSLGGAVAVHVASKYGAKGLVLDRTFGSMVDVASSHFPWLPVRWMLRNRYPSKDTIKHYDGPLVQVHGQPDRIVPFAFGVELYEAAPSSDKQFIASESLQHNDPWPEETYQQVGKFLDRL